MCVCVRACFPPRQNKYTLKLQKWSNHILLLSSVQSLSHVQLSATPRTASRQASLSITNSRSLLILMSMESVIPSYHLILCHPLLFYIYFYVGKYISSIYVEFQVYIYIYAYKYFSYFSLNVNFRNIHLWSFFPVYISWLVPALFMLCFCWC